MLYLLYGQRKEKLKKKKKKNINKNTTDIKAGFFPGCIFLRCCKKIWKRLYFSIFSLELNSDAKLGVATHAHTQTHAIHITHIQTPHTHTHTMVPRPNTQRQIQVTLFTFLSDLFQIIELHPPCFFCLNCTTVPLYTTFYK